MPWIAMYLTTEDVDTLVLMLSKDKEVAFLVPTGPYQWRATLELMPPYPERVAVWHIRSGPLPLVGGEVDHADQPVPDPWAGWTERHTGHDPSTPYFGVGRPNVLWLNLRPKSPEDQHAFGLSSLEWIGNRYRAIGLTAKPETVRWWRLLRRRLTRIAKRVPRGTLSAALPPEVFAFPNAYRYLEVGCSGDPNPFDKSL